jgi:ubiquitin-activating enzyme E1 C
MSASNSQPNEPATSADWEGRYYHIDQVLDKPGPRTDPAFLAGDGVRQCITLNPEHLTHGYVL